MPTNRVDPPAADSEPEPRDVDGTDHGGPAAIERLHRQAEEFGEYVRHYLAARGDRLRAALRSAGLWAIVGLVALTVVLAMLATATAIAILGLAEIAGTALGDRPGAGYLVTGGGLLAITAIGLVGAVLLLKRSFRKGTVKRYARRHERQKARFGHDASQQAAAGRRERS